MLRGKKQGKKLTITQNEGDFGIILPIHFSSMEDGETIKVIVKQKTDDETKIFDKDFVVESGKLDFQLTKEDTDKLKEGSYKYDMLHYRNDVLQNTLLVDQSFIVEEGVKHGD